MQAISWAPTIVLLICLGLAIHNVVRVYQAQQVRHQTMAQTLESYISESRIVNERWPDSLLESSHSAQITINEEELINQAIRFNDLSPTQLVDLSQAEKINLALIYYYFGNETLYQRWLQEAKNMDPNEPIFND